MTPDSNTSDSVNNRPRTSKNAETHPGTAAQEALRVNAPRRDPAVIQQEKEAVKERKASKDKEKKANQARNEATKSIADEFRAQQVTKQAIDEAEMPRKTAMTSKGKSQYWTFLSLIYILDTKKKTGNNSVSGNTKTNSSQPQSMGLANAGTAGKKRKSEPQAGHGANTPTHDEEQAPPPPKKKTKTSDAAVAVKPSQPSGTTTDTERNHSAPSKTKGMNKSAKKRPTVDESNDTSVDANLAHPAKKAKVDHLGASTAPPIRRSGKITLNF
jgi:hypothetical protein